MSDTGREPTRILVVDDEPRICQFLEVLLQREGHAVVSAGNAAEAMGRLEREAFDLVISDLRMPGVDGFELVKHVKSVHKDLPVIMVTGYATIENAVKALRFGVDDYVTKPFDLEELRRAVTRTLLTRRLERENRALVEQLRRMNAELERHRRLLSRKVVKTGQELDETRGALKEHAGHLSIMSQLGELAAVEHDLDRLLQQVAAAVNRQFGARYTSVMLREGDSLVIRACEGERAQALLGRRQGLAEGVAGFVASQEQPVLVRDLARDEQFRPSAGRAYATGSFLSVPITHRRQLLGVINVGDRRDGAAFEAADLNLLVAIANQLAPAVENAALYRALEVRCAAVIQALASTLEAKDRYTSGHSNRVGAYAAALARAGAANEAEVDTVSQAAQLHDIGKIGISDLILGKPGRLDPAERELIWSHPVVGEHIVQSLDFLNPARPLIRHHHEHVNGRGYPDGLRGDEIPVLARVLSVADAFDAMTSARPYRPAMAIADACQEMRTCAGEQFDGELVDLFCREVAPYIREEPAPGPC